MTRLPAWHSTSTAAVGAAPPHAPETRHAYTPHRPSPHQKGTWRGWVRRPRRMDPYWKKTKRRKRGHERHFCGDLGVLPAVAVRSRIPPAKGAMEDTGVR